MKMLVSYKAGHTPFEAEVTKLMPGVGEYDCLDCDGTGKFIMPDDTKEMCVACKGTGKMMVSI